jgi:hypothetical protein
VNSATQPNVVRFASIFLYNQHAVVILAKGALVGPAGFEPTTYGFPPLRMTVPELHH